MVVSVTLGRHFADFLKPTISSSVLVISSPIQPTHCQGAPSSTGTACNWEARLLDSRSLQKRSNQTQETCKALCVAVFWSERSAESLQHVACPSKLFWFVSSEAISTSTSGKGTAYCSGRANLHLIHPSLESSNYPKIVTSCVPNHAKPAQLYTCQGALSSDGTACTCNWEACLLASLSFHLEKRESIPKTKHET